MVFVRPDKALNPQHQQRQQSFRAQTSGWLADTSPAAPGPLSHFYLICTLILLESSTSFASDQSVNVILGGNPAEGTPYAPHPTSL